MKSKLLLFSIFTTYVLSSCTTVMQIQEKFVGNSSTSKTFENQFLNIRENGILQKPLVAELDVMKERVKITKTYENINTEDAKDLVRGEFMKQQKCDFIVEPLLFSTLLITDTNRLVTATVSGYPAFYKNIKNYEIGDSVYFLKYRNVKF